MRVTNPLQMRTKEWPYTWFPDLYMCITEDDAFFVHIEDRRELPHVFYDQRYMQSASAYDCAKGSGNGGGEPYDLDRGQPTGDFRISTFSSRRVNR